MGQAFLPRWGMLLQPAHRIDAGEAQALMKPVSQECLDRLSVVGVAWP